MPYFEPDPDLLQWLYWVKPNGQNHKISQWPKAGSARTDTRFRFLINESPVWSASRWALRFIEDGTLGTWDFKGWLDLSFVSVGHLSGSAGVNSSGWEATVDVQNYDEDPLFGFPGVVVTVRWQHTDPDKWYQGEYWFIGQPETWTPRVACVPDLTDFERFTKGPGMPTNLRGIESFSVSDCYSFPEREVAAAGFCECNGVDAYIQLAARTPFFGWYHKMTCDVRFRSLDNAIFYGDQTGGSYRFMIDQGSVHFSGSSSVMNPLPPLNQWLAMEFERGWNVPADGNYKLRFDGQLVADFFGPNFAIQVDRIGGNVDTFGMRWADMDLKNLFVDKGNVTAPNPILDMPLIDNACDNGPLLNHGTTHNMDLPSCPP